MNLSEAIKHCLEVAEQNDAQAEKWREEGGEQWGKTTACRECAADHRQLAEWLTELKEAKRLLRLAVDDLNNIGSCKTCVKFEGICRGCRTDYKWVHADETLALIGEDGDTE